MKRAERKIRGAARNAESVAICKSIVSVKAAFPTSTFPETVKRRRKIYVDSFPLVASRRRAFLADSTRARGRAGVNRVISPSPVVPIRARVSVTSSRDISYK